MAATTDATRTDRGVAHPLDPLTTDEIARTVAILREGRGLGDEARFVDISLREPEKDELARHEAGEPIPARGRGRRGRPHRADDPRGGGVAGRRRHRHLGHRARRAGRDHARRVRRVRAGGPRRPAIPRGARPAGHLRARERDGRGVVAGRPCRARRAGPAAGVDAVLVPREPRRQRVRPPDRGPLHRRRPQHDGGAARRGHQRRPRPGGVRRVPAGPGRPASRRRARRSRSSSPRARASRSRAARCGGRSGGSGSASRRARGSSCTRSPTTTRTGGGRSCTGRRMPSWSSPTATRARAASARTPTTSASTASAP